MVPPWLASIESHAVLYRGTVQGLFRQAIRCVPQLSRLYSTVLLCHMGMNSLATGPFGGFITYIRTNSSRQRNMATLSVYVAMASLSASYCTCIPFFWRLGLRFAVPFPESTVVFMMRGAVGRSCPLMIFFRGCRKASSWNMCSCW